MFFNNPGKFKMGDFVKKTKGSMWRGYVVGVYKTDLTPEGYAVESSTEKGSVQIYPAAALELCKEVKFHSIDRNDLKTYNSKEELLIALELEFHYLDSPTFTIEYQGDGIFGNYSYVYLGIDHKFLGTLYHE